MDPRRANMYELRTAAKESEYPFAREATEAPFGICNPLYHAAVQWRVSTLK